MTDSKFLNSSILLEASDIKSSLNTCRIFRSSWTLLNIFLWVLSITNICMWCCCSMRLSCMRNDFWGIRIYRLICWFFSSLNRFFCMSLRIYITFYPMFSCDHKVFLGRHSSKQLKHSYSYFCPGWSHSDSICFDINTDKFYCWRIDFESNSKPLSMHSRM